jgi:hypothetical protein
MSAICLEACDIRSAQSLGIVKSNEQVISVGHIQDKRKGGRMRLALTALLALFPNRASNASVRRYTIHEHCCGVEEKSLQHQLRAVQNALAALNVLPNGAPRNWFLSEAISTQTDLVCCSKKRNLIGNQGTLGEVRAGQASDCKELAYLSLSTGTITAGWHGD